jgi:hypothetical protein
MEWLFVREDNSSYFRLLIQAKKLHGHGKVWTRRSYPEIFHHVPSTGRLQSETLVSEAQASPATYPLYIFYTHQSVCDLAAHDKKLVEGVSLVCGNLIHGQVMNRLAGTISVAEASKLGVIQPNMFPLASILCGVGGTGTLEVTHSGLHFLVNLMELIGPTPEEVRARLVEALGPDRIVPDLAEGAPDFGAPPDVRSRYRVIFRSPSREIEHRIRRASGVQG